ncbi:MAG TPA: oligosaccharide flippase family protein [Chloroflexi bacterium]|jgi:lipopolysaccharide exporter|nr:oligosaccharide flippase family protein [Chloroflexota bacterium]
MTVAEEGLPVEGTTPDASMARIAATHKRGTSFAGDVLKLVSGTTLAQAIGMLITPILTRMYPPEAFGTLALFTSITGILGVVACLRYELAIMLPETDEEAANLLAVSLLAVVAITALTIPAITLGRPLVVGLLKAPDLGPYLWLVPVAVFFGGVFLATNHWNSRTRSFGRLSVARVISATTTSGVRVGAGAMGHNTGGSLVGTAVLGPLLSSVALGAQIWRDDRGLFRRAIRWNSMWALLKRYGKFPLYSTWSSLLNTMSWQLPPFLLSYFFSQTVVGYYDLSNRLLHLPMSLIGGAIAQVFFQRAAEARTQGRLDEVVRGVYRRLVSVGMFPFIVLALTGREVFAVVLGAEWSVAGTYTQILSIWTFFWFVSSPLTHVFSVLERPDISLRLNIVIFITRFVTLAVGGALRSVYLSLALFTLSGVVVYGYVNSLALSRAGVPFAFGLRTVVKQFCAVIPFMAVVVASKVLIPSPVIITVVSILALGANLIYVVWHDPQMRHIIAERGDPALRRIAQYLDRNQAQ